MNIQTRFRVYSLQQSLANRGLEAQGRAQKFLDNEVLKTSEPYIPMDTGALKQSGINGTVVGSGKLVYNSPYARYQYYGKLMVGKAPKTLTNTPLNYHSGDSKRGAFWFERAKADHLEKWIRGTAQAVGGHT